MCDSGIVRKVFGGGEKPKPPPPPKPAAAVQKNVDEGVKRRRQGERRRGMQAAGRQSTIATGSQGLASSANTTQKTLLGQ